MPRKIDTAFVEFLPDLRNFTRTADTELNRAFSHIEREAAQSANQVERQFTQMEREIEDVFNEIANTGTIDMERLTAVARNVATSVGRDFQVGGEVAEDAFTEIRRTGDREMDRLDRDVTATTAKIAGKFGALKLALTGAIFGVGTALVAGLGAITTFGLVSAAQLEQVQISFNSLLGSAEEGQRVFRELQKFAAVTPFEFPDVANAAKRFLAFAQNVGMSKDQLQGFLTVVGDLASVTGTGAEGLNRIVLAMGQIASKGKLQLEELMQISEAVPGFSAVGAVAQALGVTTAKAMEMISAGEVNATVGINALLEGMKKFPGAAGAMEKQSQTLLGVFSTFKDTVSQTLADAFAPVIPDIKKALTDATPIIGDALKTLAPAIGSLLSAIAPLFSVLVKLIVPLLVPILDALGPAMTKLAPAIEELAPALGEMAKAMVPIIPIAADLLLIILQLVEPLMSAFIPVMKLIAVVLTAVEKPLAELARAMQMIDWGKVGHAIADAFKAAGKAIGDFFGAVGRFFMRIVGFFRALPGRILHFIMDIPRIVLSIISKMFDLVIQAIGIGIGLIIFNFTKLPGLILGALIKLPGFLVDIMTKAWTNALTIVTTVGAKILDFVLSLPGKIINGIMALGPAIATLFTNMWDKAKKIVSNAISAIVDFVRNFPKRIKDFGIQIATNIVNFFKGFLNHVIDQLNAGIARVDDILPGSLPRIPRLAQGGVAFGPAMIGEDRGTAPEAAIPLGDARALAMLRDALGTGASIVFGPGSVVVNVAGDVSAQRARQIGTQVGAGIADVLKTRGVRLAVRAM